MTERFCSVCNCRLAHDNTTTTCAAHQVPDEEAVASCYLEGEQLVCIIAGILLVHHSLSPGEPVILQSELRRLGVEATTEQIHNATRGLPRRGLALFSKERQAGYTLREWITPGQAMMRAARQEREERELLAKGSTTDEED